MNPDIIGHLLKRVNSTISTKINMGSLRLFYPFGLSSAIDPQMEYYWNTNPDYVHM